MQVTSAQGRKGRLFLFELLHQCSTTLLLYGEPFYLKARFSWAPAQIAVSMAVVGLCIAAGAFAGGQIAHRARPRVALIVSLIGCLFGALLGLLAHRLGSRLLLLIVMAIVSLFQAMAWPAIEAAIMEGEPPERVQQFVGYYNLVWSFGTATAFLLTTPIMTRFGLASVFSFPAVFFAANLLFLIVAIPLPPLPPPDVVAPLDPSGRTLTPHQRHQFRLLGWLANPLAYVAINVIVIYNPVIASRFRVGFAAASVWCSVWLYARMAAFELFRRWRGWCYHWQFLCGAYAVAVVSFALMLIASNLLLFLVAQVALGLTVGLIYQSSLFYSMAGSETQGAHGGFHECVIGLGQVVGPLITLSGAHLRPSNPNLPIWMVVGMMTVGLAGLIKIGLSTAAPA